MSEDAGNTGSVPPEGERGVPDPGEPDVTITVGGVTQQGGASGQDAAPGASAAPAAATGPGAASGDGTGGPGRGEDTWGEFMAQMREWRAAIQRFLPPWWTKAFAGLLSLSESSRRSSSRSPATS